MNAREHMGRVAALGCIVDGCGAPASLHHPRFAAGIGQRASDYLVIPLCPMHHKDGGVGVALHAGQVTFERMYGTEAELLARTIEKLFRG